VERDSGIHKRRRKLRFLGLGFRAHRGFGVRTMTPEGDRVREGICGAVRDLGVWSRTVCVVRGRGLASPFSVQCQWPVLGRVEKRWSGGV